MDSVSTWLVSDYAHKFVLHSACAMCVCVCVCCQYIHSSLFSAPTRVARVRTPHYRISARKLQHATAAAVARPLQTSSAGRTIPPDAIATAFYSTGADASFRSR